MSTEHEFAFDLVEPTPRAAQLVNGSDVYRVGSDVVDATGLLLGGIPSAEDRQMASLHNVGWRFHGIVVAISVEPLAVRVRLSGTQVE